MKNMRLPTTQIMDVAPSRHRATLPDRKNLPSPAEKTTSRKRARRAGILRSVDDLWFGEEALYLGMKVFTEEELAQHAKVPVAQVGTWISQHRLPTLPTSNGTVRISEAVFDEWAKRLSAECVIPMTDEPSHNAAADCLPVITEQNACSVDGPSCKPTIVEATTPTWIDKEMTLMWGNVCLKTFSKSARVIQMIMQEFEKALWKTPVAVPVGTTKRQAMWALTHINLDRQDIIAFGYSANLHTKKTPMYWSKLQNS